MISFLSNNGIFVLALSSLLSSGCTREKSDSYIRIHDPTTIRNFDGIFMLFSTTGGSDDKGIKARYYSAKEDKWVGSGDVLTGDSAPQWLKILYPNNQ